MAMVLKTIVAATSPWVRIPRPPLTSRNVSGHSYRQSRSGRDGRKKDASGHDPVPFAPLRPESKATEERAGFRIPALDRGARERDELRAAMESRAQVLEESRVELRHRAERAEHELDAARAELVPLRREPEPTQTPASGRRRRSG